MAPRSLFVVLISLVGAGCGGAPSAPPKDECRGSICGATAGGNGATGGDGGNGGAARGGTGGGIASQGGSGGVGATTGGAPIGGSGDTGGDESGGSGATGGVAGDGGTGGAGGAAATGGSGGGSGAGSGGSGPCQGGDCGPVADLDLEFYKCNIEPIFDRSCAMLGCHGSEARLFRIYARGRLRNDQDLTTAQNPAASGCLRSETMNLNEMGTGTIMCEGWTRHTDEEWQKNFESSASFMRVNMNPEDSELLTQPTVGGLPHVNVHPFRRDDENYAMIVRWLSGETLGRACDPGYN